MLKKNVCATILIDKPMKKNDINVYLDGEFVSYTSILAPLTLYAYGSYTTLKYSPQGALFLDKHLQRLQYNCQELNIQYPSDEKIVNAIKSTIEKNDYTNKDVIVRVSLFPEEIKWANPQEIKNTPCSILVTTREMYFLPRNFKLKTVNLTRNLPHLKTVTYVVNFIAKAQAREAGYHDGLFVNENSNITEGTAWNIFFIKNNSVITPCPKSGILEGITRGAIINICNELDINISAETMPLDEIGFYEAAFTTNASQGPHGVEQIDDHTYDINHPALLKIKQAYGNLPIKQL